jgi:predicted acetyltransferase
MAKFSLVRPTEEYEQAAMEYVNEFKQYNSEIHGVGSLHKYLNKYQEWLNNLEKMRETPVTSDLVPAETFFLVREEDNKIIGMVDIRLALNDFLKNMVVILAIVLDQQKEEKAIIK